MKNAQKAFKREVADSHLQITPNINQNKFVELSEQLTAILKRLSVIAEVISVDIYDGKIRIHVRDADMTEVAACLGGTLKKKVRVGDAVYDQEQYVTTGAVRVFQLVHEGYPTHA